MPAVGTKFLKNGPKSELGLSRARGKARPYVGLLCACKSYLVSLLGNGHCPGEHKGECVLVSPKIDFEESRAEP
jgi:hypothetical protein